MKRLLLTVLAICSALSCMYAQEAESGADARKTVPMVLRAYGEYGYNHTAAHYGSAAVTGRFRLTGYFDLQVGVKARTSNIHAADIRGMVYFPLQGGRLMLEPRFTYEASLRTMTHHFNASLSLGWQMDHFRVQIGCSARAYRAMDEYDNSAGLLYVTDPFNLYYSIEGYLRKDSDFWNLGLKLANYDDFIIEHDTHPLVMLVGKYRPTDRLGIFAEVYYRASGVAHVANDFYDAGIRIGVNYHFDL